MRALLFTTGSPFARGARIILDKLGLEWERREEITTPTVEQRAEASPTLQVPTLRDGDLVLWESSLIAEYLMTEYGERPAGEPPLAAHFARPSTQWEDRLIFATIQTLGTAATTISQTTWAGIRFDQNDYLTRCADRLPHLLGWIEARVTKDDGFFPGELSAQDIFLCCHLAFIANRPLGLDPRLERFPGIHALTRRVAERPSFERNPILWWEPGVIGYAEDGKTPVYQN